MIVVSTQDVIVNMNSTDKLNFSFGFTFFWSLVCVDTESVGDLHGRNVSTVSVTLQLETLFLTVSVGSHSTQLNSYTIEEVELFAVFSNSAPSDQTIATVVTVVFRRSSGAPRRVLSVKC